MYRLAKWLWRKAEKTTARSVMDMINAFYTEPQNPDSMSSVEYRHAYDLYKSSRTLIDLIDRRYFPERHMQQIQSEIDFHKNLKEKVEGKK